MNGTKVFHLPFPRPGRHDQRCARIPGAPAASTVRNRAAISTFYLSTIFIVLKKDQQIVSFSFCRQIQQIVVLFFCLFVFILKARAAARFF
ncbi:MAG: hypothetical protein KF865_09090 [Bdellovibrionaceae bacterium]|nr:hypothetical protein [Pseudobdellovibrionaceae bacterium]